MAAENCTEKISADATGAARHSGTRMPQPISAICFNPLVNLPAARIVGFAAQLEGVGPDGLRAACRAATQWPDSFSLTIELSHAQWRDPTTGLHVLAALGKSGLASDRLELAIPDVLPARDLHITRNLVDELRRFGVRIALTGCGALASAAMPSFEIDKIELAPHLVHRLGRDPQSERMASALVALAEEHGVVPAAAGIDSGGLYDTLREAGCVEGFGRLFGKPVAEIEIAPLLRIPGLADPLDEAVAQTLPPPSVASQASPQAFANSRTRKM